MMPLLAKIKSLKPPDMVASEFRGYVREAIAFALDDHFHRTFHKRFGKRASSSRRYSRRTTRHLIAKARRFNLHYERVGKGIKFDGLPVNVDPRPFEFSLTLRNTAYSGRNIKVLKIKPKGTLTMPFGHPINPKNVGEFDRVLKYEWAEMRRVMLDKLQDLIESAGTPSGVTFS